MTGELRTGPIWAFENVVAHWTHALVDPNDRRWSGAKLSVRGDARRSRAPSTRDTRVIRDSTRCAVLQLTTGPQISCPWRLVEPYDATKDTTCIRIGWTFYNSLC